eukprot:UN03562
MSSIDWIPILKPIVLDLLTNKLSNEITYHIPSYNQGVILLDPHSLRNYFKTNQSIKLKLDPDKIDIKKKTKQIIKYSQRKCIIKLKKITKSDICKHFHGNNALMTLCLKLRVILRI